MGLRAFEKPEFKAGMDSFRPPAALPVVPARPANAGFPCGPCDAAAEIIQNVLCRLHGRNLH